MRTTRAITAGAATLAIVGWTLTAGASYSLVSAFVHIKPVTAVADGAPGGRRARRCAEQSGPGDRERAVRERHPRLVRARPIPPSASDLSVLNYGDQALPRLPNGGLVHWLETRDQLHHLLHSMGFGHHFLYSLERAERRPVAGWRTVPVAA